MNNILLYNVHYPFQGTTFIDSIKKFMPNSPIYQLSDMETPRVKGTTLVIRGYARPYKHFTPFIGYEYLSNLDLRNLIVMDMDMLLNAPIDDVFNDDFDIAVCRRGRREGVRRILAERFPYCSIMFTRTTEFWKDCYNLMKTYRRRLWTDDMTAKKTIIESGKYKVKLLDSKIYNNIPRNKDDYNNETRVFHFKSRRIDDRKLFIQYFYDRYIRNR